MGLVYRQTFFAILLSILSVGTASAQELSTGNDHYGRFWGQATGPYADTNCGPGSVAIGIQGNAGWQVDSVRLICAPVIGYGVLGTAYYAGGAGGFGGSWYQLQCASGYAVEGIYGKSGLAIDRLGIRCRTLDWKYAYTAGFTGGTGGSDFWDSVNPGEFVTGLSTRSAIFNSSQVIVGIAARYSTIYW